MGTSISNRQLSVLENNSKSFGGKGIIGLALVITIVLVIAGFVVFSFITKDNSDKNKKNGTDYEEDNNLYSSNTKGRVNNGL